MICILTFVKNPDITNQSELEGASDHEIRESKAKLVQFDSWANFMTVSMGGWSCESVAMLSYEEILAIAGDGHGGLRRLQLRSKPDLLQLRRFCEYRI